LNQACAKYAEVGGIDEIDEIEIVHLSKLSVIL